MTLIPAIRQLLVLAIVAASLASTAASQSAGAQDAAGAPRKLDPAVLEFLVDAASSDFKLQAAAPPSGFRAVRVGHYRDSAGRELYILCGSFTSGASTSPPTWTPFATIKSGDKKGDYEQWIGGQAVPLCRIPKINWYKEDRTQLLLNRH
jgi:hypothetical protein